MKFAVTIIGTVVLVLLTIVSSGSARPEGSTGEATSTVAAKAEEGSSTTTLTPTTAVPEESKMSKFFDDVSSAFKTGTAKVKESFESAASSVKDGVLRGYGFVKDKLTGTSDAAASSNETVTLSSTTVATLPVTPTAKLVSARSITGNSATAKAIGVEPNDEETKDEDKLIFIGDEDTATDSVVVPPTTTTTTAPLAAESTNKTKLDDRWIIDGPTACKSGQTVVNGKCRNTF